MGNSEEQVKLATKIYKSRDSARFLLGGEYAERMNTYGGYIKAVMKKHGIDDEIKATMKAIEVLGNKAEAMAVIFFMAACVELIEPTKTSATSVIVSKIPYTLHGQEWVSVKFLSVDGNATILYRNDYKKSESIAGIEADCKERNFVII